MEAMGEAGGTLVTTLAPNAAVVQRSDVRIVPVLSYTAVGKAFVKGDGNPETPAKPEDKIFAGNWWANVEHILQAGRLQLSDIAVQEGGLGQISKGLDIGLSGANGAGKGGKMVYRIG